MVKWEIHFLNRLLGCGIDSLQFRQSIGRMKEQPTIEESGTTRFYQFRTLGIKLSYDIRRDEFFLLTLYGEEVDGFMPYLDKLWAGVQFTDKRSDVRSKFRCSPHSGAHSGSTVEWDLYKLGRYEIKFSFDTARGDKLVSETITQVRDGWRAPNATELSVLKQLLGAEFPGANELRQQLPGMTVLEVDSERSIILKVKNQIPAFVVDVVPVEGEYSDSNDPNPYAPRVRALVHVQGFLLDELEFYKDDGTPILRYPEPGELELAIHPLMVHPYFALLGTSTRSPLWRRFLQRFSEDPEILKGPKGFQTYSLLKSGVQAFFFRSKLSSIAFYGHGAEKFKFSPYTGTLPAQLWFDSKSDEIRAKLGKPILVRHLKPPLPVEPNLPEEEWQSHLAMLKGLPFAMRSEVYKLGSYCLTIDFDEENDDAIFGMELAEYEAIRLAHNLPADAPH